MRRVNRLAQFVAPELDHATGVDKALRLQIHAFCTGAGSHQRRSDCRQQMPLLEKTFGFRQLAGQCQHALDDDRLAVGQGRLTIRLQVRHVTFDIDEWRRLFSPHREAIAGTFFLL
ncbi:MAG: hypothetical protein JWQ24_4916 [Tardiphaga sp.]|nr:hypothetical protein [Tardiphaga sp.]